MTQKDTTFKSADGVSVIHAHYWLPEKKPVALLQMLHGMQEYIERYDGFARFLCDKGFAVAGHDHIFHGQSAATPEERGIAHTDEPHSVMVEDAFTFYGMLEEEFSDIPHFILGHSMGSYILRMLLCEKSGGLGRLAGALILGTGSEKQFKLACGKLILGLMIKMKGRDGYSRFLNDMSFSGPYKKFDMTGQHPENSWLSRDVENVRRFAKDPVCDFSFTIGAMKTLICATYYDNIMSNIKKMRRDLPVIFASGTEDPVGNMGQGVRDAYDKFIKAGLNNVTIKLYEDDRHEILNEVDREQVYRDLYDWMLLNM